MDCVALCLYVCILYCCCFIELFLTVHCLLRYFHQGVVVVVVDLVVVWYVQLMSVRTAFIVLLMFPCVASARVSSACVRVNGAESD